jgi:predicted GIY-YIG superfamily endonuclease
MVNALSCPSCSISLFKLAKHIHDKYSWVCYIIKQNNIVKYIGYTTDLLSRIKSHISQGIISKITQYNAKSNILSLNKYNISIAVSLHLSEKDLIKIFKPYYNLCEGRSYTIARLMKGGNYIEMNAPQYHTYNIDSILINTSINKPHNNIIYDKNVGIINGIASPNYKFVYDSRSYCYRWRGKCRCQIPCKQQVNTMMLREVVDKTYDAGYNLKLLKQTKLQERYEILKALTGMPDDILRGHLNSSFIMSQYMDIYNKMTDIVTVMPTKKQELESESTQVSSIGIIDTIKSDAEKSYVYSDNIVMLSDTISDI